MASHLHSPNLYLQAPKTYHDLTVFVIKFTELLNKFIFPDIYLKVMHLTIKNSKTTSKN